MNSNTQNKKIAAITEKTLIVGIDVGSETHYARVPLTGEDMNSPRDPLRSATAKTDSRRYETGSKN